MSLLTLIFWDLVDRRTLAAFITQLKERYKDSWLSSRELLESRAVQEGFCDYIAGITFEDPDILPGLPLRNLADESFIVHRLALLPHLRGWGQFLWQIRRRWPRKVQADQIAFSSLSYWDQAAGLEGAVEALKRGGEEHLKQRQARRYHEIVREVVKQTHLLEPPIQAEISWHAEPDDGLLSIEEAGKFFFMSRNGGLILQGVSQGGFHTQVQGNNPLFVYSAAPVLAW